MGGGSRTAAVLGLAVSAALISAGPAWAGEPEPTSAPPSLPVTATTSTTVFPSSPPSPGAGRLAGTVAGEGRRHPGRETDDETRSDHEDAGRPQRPAAPHAPSPSSAPRPPGGAAPARQPAHQPARAPARDPADQADPADRVIRVLPLGTGMTLTGLGLGFLALRLRRR
ncbi:hypothetical protein LE181_15475 [Streptomyces sp. SCA3-4]|uniref:hypothetical protein n=1 Tax=Streptomyces sichuanensis TaxID=2871810 RepID=UPI001CE2E884|nr:hypothetical protein [Streptomyces sichuanensis]MCA6093555.1 hypothetical protein [Streptomyces sichuanensis]